MGRVRLFSKEDVPKVSNFNKLADIRIKVACSIPLSYEEEIILVRAKFYPEEFKSDTDTKVVHKLLLDNLKRHDLPETLPSTPKDSKIKPIQFNKSETLYRYLDELQNNHTGLRLFALKDIQGKKISDSHSSVVYFSTKPLAREVRDVLYSTYGLKVFVTKGPDHSSI